MMQDDNATSGRPASSSDDGGRVGLGWRLALGTLTVIVGLTLAGLAGQGVERWFDDPPALAVQTVQALVMSLIVIPLICLLRLRADRRALSGIGFGRPASAAGFFLLGFGIVFSVVLIPVLVLALTDWATVSVNITASLLWTMLAWLLVALLFEAFPEEIAIRGYLYRNLNAVLARWLAALASIGLFLIIPIGVALLGYLPGIPFAAFAGSGSLSIDYLLTIALFGAVLIYLRVITGSVWTCVGFHLGFLQLGRGTWVGDDQQSLFQIEAAQAAQVDLIFQLTGLVVLLAVLIVPWLVGCKPGWRERGAG